jgi:hypothetical protein
MLYGADVAVCSKINTKQTNTVGAECHFLSCKTVGAHNQEDLKGKNVKSSHYRPELA